jgi:hypothetical protein
MWLWTRLFLAGAQVVTKRRSSIKTSHELRLLTAGPLEPIGSGYGVDAAAEYERAEALVAAFGVSTR